MVSQPIDEREPPRLLPVAEAARLLGISPNHLWNLIARREIASIRLGGRRLIARSEVERIVAMAAQGGQQA